MIAQPVTLDSGDTGVSRPSIQTAESPAGACWSSTRSATSCSFFPDSCRDVEASACAVEVSAATHMPSRFASSATSIVTALQPLVEMARSASSGAVTKFRQRTGPKPCTFSRNIACRWPLAPTTGL